MAKNDLQSVTVRIPARMIQRMDAWGERSGIVKRSDVLRMLLVKALDAEEADQAQHLLPKELAASVEAYKRKRGNLSDDKALAELLSLGLDAADLPDRKPPRRVRKLGLSALLRRE